jgi:hypothetical protein
MPCSHAAPVLSPEAADSLLGFQVTPDNSASRLASMVRGLDALWAETRGDPAITIAVLDGPVDLAHPCLNGANLTQIESLTPTMAATDAATEHGTHIASVLFGRPGSPLHGVAPFCRGISIPIFSAGDDRTFNGCSQIDLARALGLAVQHGAHVINVSGGELSPTGQAHPLLENAIDECRKAGVLIVAAAGNQGCDCLHIPASIGSVLAVGGMDAMGRPLDFSNWGLAYIQQGVLAPAIDIPGAHYGGDIINQSGTSYATPIVTGVAALLLSLQRKQGRKPDPALVRQAILTTASGCSVEPVSDCRRLLAGRLSVSKAVLYITRSTDMDQPQTIEAAAGETIEPSLMPVAARRVATEPETPPQAEAAPKPKTCSCGGHATAAAPQLVFALGQLGYDLITEARCDSLVQKIAGLNGDMPLRGLAFDHTHMLGYLEKNPWDAAAVEWTLNSDGTPIYAIRPQGPFASRAYECLREFLAEQERHEIERVSIPGTLSGKARLLNGQVVPVLVPELRGMYSWTTAAVVKAVVGAPRTKGSAANGHADHDRKAVGVRNFLDRIYHSVRNLGMMPQERAMNFVATNAHEAGEIFESAIKDKMELDSVNVSRSPICRPESDCWDVELYFFYPERQVQTVRKVYRCTVDVSDVVPVTIGQTRSWFTR